MCLTEAQAGSDVGASTTKAVKQDDGSYLITGEKIFITGGDHNLADNIVHLVLARTPGAPVGTKGLSLFIVPKIRANADGSLGESNDVFTNNIEEKMGIHGSPTCTLVFGQNDGCQGFLLGEELQGMKLMFHLMNAARIDVGLQGLAAAGAAHQQALSYAKERLQSRHWKELRNPEAPQVPIIEHPDVRRMLLGSKAYAEAMRALLYMTSYYLDMSHLTEGEESERYHSYVEMLTPICKAWCSEWGVQVTHWCLQVHGGYGYTSDYPAEQFMRDAEIACIYEGTNGIQALDFVARKLPMNKGQTIRELLGMAEDTFKKLKGDPEMMEPAWMLAAALKQIETISKEITKRPDAIQLILLNAPPLLDMVGTVLGAHFLLDQAILAKTEIGRDPRRPGRRHRRQEGLQGIPPGTTKRPPSTTTRSRPRSTSPTVRCPRWLPRAQPSAPARRRRSTRSCDSNSPTVDSLAQCENCCLRKAKEMAPAMKAGVMFARVQTTSYDLRRARC